MEQLLTPTMILFGITITGIIFTIYHYFKNPQISSEKEDISIKALLDALTKDLANLKQNHIHTLHEDVKRIDQTVASMSVEVAKLSTIIEERIPQRKT